MQVRFSYQTLLHEWPKIRIAGRANAIHNEAMVFCYLNCSIPTVRKKYSSFEITRTIYSNSERSKKFLVTECFFNWFLEVSHIGEHITDIYITETDTTELENLSHNTIDIFIIETWHDSHLTLLILKNIHICHKWSWHIWSLE